MSEQQKVSTVLVAVPLYSRNGKSSCVDPAGVPCPFLRGRDEDEERPDYCGYHEHEADIPFIEDEEGFWYSPPSSHCPLRAPEALTVEEVMQYGYGYPQVMHHINSQGQKACSGCYGTDYKHADTCCALAAQRSHVSTHNKLIRSTGEVRSGKPVVEPGDPESTCVCCEKTVDGALVCPVCEQTCCDGRLPSTDERCAGCAVAAERRLAGEVG